MRDQRQPPLSKESIAQHRAKFRAMTQVELERLYQIEARRIGEAGTLPEAPQMQIFVLLWKELHRRRAPEGRR